MHDLPRSSSGTMHSLQRYGKGEGRCGVSEPSAKIIQIAVASLTEGADSFSEIYALRDDGSIWFTVPCSGQGWTKMPPILEGGEDDR
jgi:hypothetical protein